MKTRKQQQGQGRACAAAVVGRKQGRGQAAQGSLKEGTVAADWGFLLGLGEAFGSDGFDWFTAGHSVSGHRSHPE